MLLVKCLFYGAILIRPLASSQKITTKSGRNKEEILPPGQKQQVPKRATMRNQIIGITSSVLMMAICVTSFAPAPLRLDKLLARRGLFAEPGSEEDKFDMEELNQRIEDASNQYEKLFLTKEWERRPKPADVHIVLFKPDTDDEGVHTIEYPKGSGRNVILAFESAKECATFVSILKLQRFFDPSVSVVIIIYVLTCIHTFRSKCFQFYCSLEQWI